MVSQAGHGYLMVGPVESLLYYQPNTRVQSLARLPAWVRSSVWSDVRRRDWVWVHYLRDDAVHRFELPAGTLGQGGVVWDEHLTLVKAVLLESVQLLRVRRQKCGTRVFGGFIARAPTLNRPTMMCCWFRIGGKTGSAQARESSVTLASSDGRKANVELRGYPFSMVEADGRIALVTHHTSSDRREWQLEVKTSAGKIRRVDLPGQQELEQAGQDHFATEVTNRSLCFVPGKPWVVVGGKTAAWVFDYDSGRTLLTLGQ